MKRWKKQIDELPIPYPQKKQLLAEIEDHIQNSSESENEGFEDDDLEELVLVHNNHALLFLRQLPPAVRNAIELTLIGGPLVGLLPYLTYKGGYMYQFFINGGVAMYAIFAIGVLLLGREALLFTRVMILKEHNKANLKMDSSSVLVGSLALTVLGIGAACLGAYVSITSALSNNSPNVIVLTGIGESITNVIASTTFAALILLIHYTTRRLLLYWQAPIEM
jgi:hypothetical protein